jgi:hypothetical protein
LRAGNYAAIADLDPRLIDPLLTELRERGIAAYAIPARGTAGGSMETRLPARPLDRLYVDDQQVDRARAIVDRQGEPEPAVEPMSEPVDSDFESSWQQVLASLQSSPTLLENPWPESENLTLAEREAAYDEAEALADAEAERDVDEHYVPPPPPPLPKLRPVTYGALAVMALSLAVMLLDFGGRDLDILAFVAFIGAAGSLVYHMRQGPSSDDDWDDGAVV